MTTADKQLDALLVKATLTEKEVKAVARLCFKATEMDFSDDIYKHAQGKEIEAEVDRIADNKAKAKKAAPWVIAGTAVIAVIAYILLKKGQAPEAIEEPNHEVFYNVDDAANFIAAETGFDLMTVGACMKADTHYMIQQGIIQEADREFCDNEFDEIMAGKSVAVEAV